MSPDHTPGPWRVEAGTTLIWGNCDLGDKSSWGMGYPVARCEHPTQWQQVLPTQEEQQANARLIAAAPDLLAALKSAREFIDDYTYELLRSYCVMDPVTHEPDRATLDETEAAHIAENDRLLAQIDAAIATTDASRE